MQPSDLTFELLTFPTQLAPTADVNDVILFSPPPVTGRSNIGRCCANRNLIGHVRLCSTLKRRQDDKKFLFHICNVICKRIFSISSEYRVTTPDYKISMKPIRKAIFPVAGLGTRFLPATKAMPKEMLPVVDRPLIQYVVDEAREAGIEHFIFVTGRNKHIIEDHFDRQVELESTLRGRQRREVIEFLARELPLPGTTSFTRQQEPLGLGHAVWCARELVGSEPFALLLPDMLIQHTPGCLAQMIEAGRQLDDAANIIAVEEAPRDHLHMYGVVGIGAQGEKAFSITEMVEKPTPEQAPSTLIVTGRYILQPEIFDLLAIQKRGAGGEIQLTDAMISLSGSQPFYGIQFEGRSFDCGSKVGFLSANVAYALARPDLAPAFRQVLREMLRSTSAQQEPDSTAPLSQTKTSHADAANHPPQLSTIG
jgi:UTP--glucose-1-phosphate uridylyltransferase